MPAKNFTVRTVDSIKPPSSGRVEYWDEETHGFGLRVSDSGRKTWVVLYRHHGRLRRLTLGTYPSLSLADARERAKDALRAAAKGKDPAGEKLADRERDTFKELAEDYIELHAKVHKRSWREDRRALDRDLLPAFQHRKADDIRRRDVKKLLAEIKARGAQVLSNRTLEIMRKIYNWGIEEERVEHNPCLGIKPFPEQSRDRVLSEDEIRALWKALDSQPEPARARFRLLLLTAQRSGEIRQMRWRDIAGDWWTVPVEFTKNRLSHRVPLPTPAMAILESMKELTGGGTWVFPSPVSDGAIYSDDKRLPALRKASGVSFVPHDLRRTAASYMASMGISRFAIGRVLNHVETSVTAVYDRHSYDREKRQALETWALRLEEILAGTAADNKVVAFRPTAS
jgi:integrase